MIEMLSIVVLFSGIAFVAAGLQLPDHALKLERCGGGLMVAGLLLLGSCLPVACIV